MNKTIQTLVIILFFVSCNSTTEKQATNKNTFKNKELSYSGDGFLVHGYLHTNEPTVFIKDTNDSILYKSTINANGYFALKGNLNDTIPAYISTGNTRLNFLLYNTEIAISKDEHFKTEEQQVYNHYFNTLTSKSTLDKSLINKIKKAIIDNKNTVKFRKILSKQQYQEIVFLKNFIKENPNHYTTLFAIQALDRRTNISNESYQKYKKTLAKDIKNTSLAFELDNYFLEKEIKSKTQQIGKVKQENTSTIPQPTPKPIVEDRAKAFYFEGETRNGTTITLPAVVRKSKLTYIDFWASWCGPCRMQNPVLRSIYKQYHKQGLSIISVSEDTDINAWKNAITIDNLPWIHIIDKDKSISRRYYVESLPFGVLVDSKGMVIADFVSAGKLKQLVPKYINEK